MNIKLVLSLSLLSILGLSAASSLNENMSTAEFPLGYFFDTDTGPRFKIKNLSDRSYKWFLRYLTDVSEAGNDLNQILPDGNTLLHLAVLENVPNMIKALIELDVNVLTKNTRGETAQLLAYEMSHAYEDSDVPFKIFTEYGFELEQGEAKKSALMDVVQKDEKTTEIQIPVPSTSSVKESLPIPPLFLHHLPYKVDPLITARDGIRPGVKPMSSNGSIAVIGATGRTGILCVQAILNSGYSCNAICRSQDKAYDVFTVVPKSQRGSLNVKEVKNIEDIGAIKEAIKGCSAVIFAACGVSFLGLFNRTGGPKHVDFGGVVALIDAIKMLKEENPETVAPKLVLISSLGVTRPYWPIYIMLNTLGGRVMTYKLRGEDCVRSAGSEIDYTIIRPGRLVPSEKNPRLKDTELVVDQGDKITGQILREDVARVALYAAINREAGNKTTFELISGQSGAEIKEEHRQNVEKAPSKGKDAAILLANLKTDLQLIK